MALSAGAAPDKVRLDRSGKGSLWLFNPSDHKISYLINSTAKLSRYEGTIPGKSHIELFITATNNDKITLLFSEDSSQIKPIAKIIIPVIPYSVPKSEGFKVMGAVMVAGGLLIFCIYFLSSGFLFR